MAKIETPRITVIMEDGRGNSEGTEYVVQSLNVDLVAWDRERAKRGWPKAEDATFVWLNYLAWKGLTRTASIPAMSLAEFEAKCLSVTSAEDEEDAAESEVDPTPTAAAPA